MSRNKEKAQSLLHQFEEQKAIDLGYININKLRRPRNVSRVDDLKTAERWRGQVMQEINSKVTKLHDEMISDYQIRDLNDDVNKLFREKTAWEYRIKELGGPNYLKFSSQTHSQLARDQFNIRNYRYFGRAKELKEVKQLVELKAKEAAEMKRDRNSQNEYVNKKLIYERMNRIGADYYGFNDENDIQSPNSENSGADDELNAQFQNLLQSLSGEEENSSKSRQKSRQQVLEANGLRLGDDAQRLDGLRSRHNNSNTNSLLEAESSLSSKLAQKLNNQYAKDPKIESNIDEGLELFLKSVSQDDSNGIPSIEDGKKHVVNWHKKKLAESWGL